MGVAWDLPYEGLLAETIRHRGHNDDEIGAYFARPLGADKVPGVVVVHHAPGGWDEDSKEATRKIAHHGYVAVMPHLHYRWGPGSSDDLSAKMRADGGVPDDQAVGDIDGANRYLRALPYCSGKVGLIGFCAGGRQVYLAACRLSNFDAAVDCWGGRVIMAPGTLTERQPVAPIDLTANLGCPLLGLFGVDDPSPSPEDVAQTELELKRHGKTYEFHSYANAGHGFFAADRPGYRPEAAVAGWQEVFKWFDKYLKQP